MGKIIITHSTLDKLSSQAKSSPQLMATCDWQNKVGRSKHMLEAIEPGASLGIMCHLHQTDTVSCLRGRLMVTFFDHQARHYQESSELSPCGPVVAVNIPAGQYYTLRALQSDTVIVEILEGVDVSAGIKDLSH